MHVRWDSTTLIYPDSLSGTGTQRQFWFNLPNPPRRGYITAELWPGPTCDTPRVQITHPAQDTTIILTPTNQPMIVFREMHTPASGDCEPVISWEPDDTLRTSEYWGQIVDSIQIPVIVTARNQYTARDTVVVTLRVEPSVEIFPPHPAYVIDGETDIPYELRITPPSISGTSFLWTAIPKNTPAGNSPHLDFSPDRYQQNVTIENARWYAFPDTSCGCSHQSTYRLSAETIISNLVYADTTLLNTFLPKEGGKTKPPHIAGGPDFVPVVGGSGNIIKWKVRRGQLERIVGSPTINVPSTSQFYNKLLAHENFHVQQQVSGSARHVFSVDRLWRRIGSLEAPTYNELVLEVSKRMYNYRNEQKREWVKGLPNVTKSYNDREIEAYEVSDVIPPLYLYQRCGRTNFLGD
jgi:hypothetical protein